MPHADRAEERAGSSSGEGPFDAGSRKPTTQALERSPLHDVNDADTRTVSAARSITLACAPESARMARRMAMEFLREHQLEHLAEVVALLTSEVVANAVVHARTPVGLRVSTVGDRLRVEARDASHVRPARRYLNLEAIDGRGLLLLDRLSTAWDVRRTPEGKTVWFELDLNH